jgi:sulfate transport system permease protein
VLPGFGLSLGFSLFYLGLVVLIPLSTLAFRSLALGPVHFLEAVSSPRVLAAVRLSFLTALLAAAANAVFGLVVAWVLARYRFPGRRLMDALVDLPFALPTAVAGIALTTIYAGNGWVGRFLEPMGVQVAYSRLGIVVALTFVGLPFVVRTVQPVLRGFRAEVEEAAMSLGAWRRQVVRRILVPRLLPAVATGFTLAFARGLGEYGSVIFIAGNLPNKSEIAPLLIVIRLEEYDYPGATAIAFVFLLAAFAVLLCINFLAWRQRKTLGHA